MSHKIACKTKSKFILIRYVLLCTPWPHLEHRWIFIWGMLIFDMEMTPKVAETVGHVEKPISFFFWCILAKVYMTKGWWSWTGGPHGGRWQFHSQYPDFDFHDDRFCTSMRVKQSWKSWTERRHPSTCPCPKTMDMLYWKCDPGLKVGTDLRTRWLSPGTQVNNYNLTAFSIQN